MTTKIAIVGDFDASSRFHHLTGEAIAHSAQVLQASFSYDWIETDSVGKHFHEITEHYKAFWIAPGAMYKNVEGALRLIEFARLHNIPTLGTCRGFQHMALEFAKNVLHIKSAQHAEYDPNASNLVVSPIACSIKGKSLEVTFIDKTSKSFAIFETEKIQTTFYCNYGLDPKYQEDFASNGFKVVAIDTQKEARILELASHKFFIATLFVPQEVSTKEHPHKLVTAFLKAAL